MYDAQTWEQVLKPRRGANGQPEQTDDGRIALFPIARPAGAVTPCASCPKSGPRDGTPRPDKELSPRNHQAYWNYLECRAIGQFPNDPIVRRNAGIIYWVEQELERWSQEHTQNLLLRGLFKRK
jgi:hypothetical protein